MGQKESQSKKQIPTVKEVHVRRLDASQLGQAWPLLEASAKATVPGMTEPLWVEVMGAIVSGKMQAWVGVTTERGGTDLVMVGLTYVKDEPWTGQKVLVVYSLHSYNKVTSGAWRSAMETLERFAAMSGCSRVEAYTDQEKARALAGRLGFSTRTQLIKEI